MTLFDWIQMRLNKQGGGDVADAIGTGVLRELQLHVRVQDPHLDQGRIGTVMVIWRDGANHQWFGQLRHFDGSDFLKPIPAELLELLERRPDEDSVR